MIKGAIEVIPWGLRADSGVTEMEAPPVGAVVEAAFDLPLQRRV